ncbi:cupin-like domain-containing protein [Burkholderiaceae bacterium UC74_6]
MQALSADVLESAEPVLLRGLVRHWPLVQAAQRSDVAFCDYLRGFGADTRLSLWRGAPEIAGRFFYNADFTGFNFRHETLRFGALLGELLAGTPDALYLGSTDIDHCFPGLRQPNDLAALAGFNPNVSIWLGNRVQVAAHFDLPDNIACVVAGRRRFTLFPPEQVGNLYVGPLDLTPAGQPISLVDPKSPDLARFPRYAEALKHARVFDLEAGDALFIPSQWWHGVEGLDEVNGLVNFWWRRTPAFMDTPLNTLLLALLTLRDLPAEQRDAWRALFDHYVFDANAETAAHIPAQAQGVLASPIPEATARQLRAALLNRLNR